MSGSSTLPPVRLNNQAYQKVTSTLDTMSGSARSNCGMKTSGRCQPVTSSPRTAADARGDLIDREADRRAAAAEAQRRAQEEAADAGAQAADAAASHQKVRAEQQHAEERAEAQRLEAAAARARAEAEALDAATRTIQES